jgi:ribosomal protein S19
VNVFVINLKTYLLNYMKSTRILLILAAWGCILPASAQKTFGSDKYTAMCNYYGETSAKAIYMSPAGASAEKVVQDIMSVIGLRANFELRASSDIPTAAAVIKKGSRYILYNPKFMSNIVSATGNKWTAVSIMAHEIGHHLNGHTLDSETSKPATELEADEFSGFVLQRMGASLPDAQAAMAAIASLKGSHTHPPKNQRLTAIASGWGKAGGKITTTAVTAYKPEQPKTIVAAPAPQPQRTETKPLTRAEKIAQSAQNDKNVVSEAYFASDPNGKYYVTSKGNLVQVDRDKVYLVGSLTQSNKPGYKMMLTDTDYNTFYVGSGGMLVNNYGKKIGYLKTRK